MRRRLPDFSREAEAEAEEEEEESEDARREREIRAQLAGVPFETLLRAQKKTADAEARASASRAAAAAAARRGQQASEGKKNQKKKKGKAAGDAPVEMTATKPVSWLREVVHTKPKVASRDPRFDGLSGKFNKGLFRASYKFLDDVRAGDEQELKSEVADLTVRAQEARELADEDPDDEDAEEAAQSVENQLREAKKALSLLVQQSRSEEARERLAERKREARKLAASSVARGKSPFYLKKSQLKRLEAEQAYRKLQKTAGSEGVERFIARQNRREVSREKRRGPAFRVRDTDGDYQ